MSHGPSTFGSMMTSSLLPAAATISLTSSSIQGEFRQLMRVQRPVVPKSFSRAMAMKPGARRFLLVRGDGVLEIAEHDVDLSRDVLDLGADFLVVRRYEVDHALEPYRQRAIGLGSADGERGIKLGRRAAAGHRVGLLLRRGALYWAAGTCQRGAEYQPPAEIVAERVRREARFWPVRRRRRWP